MKIYPMANRFKNPQFAVKSTKFRNPKKGEYYISGAIPEVYKAPKDLSHKFWIGIPVEIRTIKQAKIRTSWESDAWFNVEEL